MTEQKKKLLKAKIAAALYHEEGRVPTREEIEKWTKLVVYRYVADNSGGSKTGENGPLSPPG
jgi:hypothetical protein